MIVPKEPHLRQQIQYVGRPLLGMILFDLAVVFAYKVLHWDWLGSPHVPLGLYGSAIGIIVGFRNNSAYGRWWEARGLWGQVVNNSRSFGRQVMSTITARDQQEQTEATATQTRLIIHQVAYVHALRQHLRQLDPWIELRRLLSEEEIVALQGETNIPMMLQLSLGKMLRDCLERGWLNTMAWQALDRNLDDLADAQGGCERIKNTPMPKQYDYFPQLFVQVYCLLLPMGMVQNLGWFTPVGSTLVAFMFLALDKIGRDLQAPFDNTIFDVPMSSITRTIEINLRQLLGEKTGLPAPEKPVHGVLW